MEFYTQLPRDIWYGIRRFFENIWMFRKQLWVYVPGDFGFDLRMYQQCLKFTQKNMSAIIDAEYNETCDASIRRAIELIDIVLEDDFTDIVDKNLGYTWRNQSISEDQKRVWFEKYKEIEDSYWSELFDLQKAHIKTWWA